MNAFAPDFDARAHAAFAAAGMADNGDYAPPAGGSTPAGARRCFLNPRRQTLGELGHVLARRTVIGVLLADGAVEQGGTLVVDARTYTLQQRDETDDGDGSLEWWVVR